MYYLLCDNTRDRHQTHSGFMKDKMARANRRLHKRDVGLYAFFVFCMFVVLFYDFEDFVQPEFG